MEAAGGRRVKNGKEYEELFPLPTGNDTTIKKDADVGNTVKFIQEQVPKTLSQTKAIANLLKGKTLEETCSNIWYFTYDHIPYKRDEDGIEQVRSPRRTWHDRNVVDSEGKVGVDCDCYSVFISSILMNLDIPHKYRITKYEKRNGNTPRWQHIYVVVPLDGKLKKPLTDSRDYITMDCVKDQFDTEEPYLEHKDYNANMRLDYLDGLEGDEEFEVPNSVDARDMASVYDEEDLGKVGQWVKKAVKKVGNTAGKVMRTVNKVANPGTILLRNGFLEAMKINLLNVAGRLRYAYLSDDKAKSMGINLSELAKLRKIKDKAETIYWQAGGEKKNLKKAILSGKGNKDKKIPLSGFEGFGGTYADQEEYDIVNGLGEPVTAASVAAATTVMTTIATALNQVKGIFKTAGSIVKPGSSSSKSTDNPQPGDNESPVEDAEVIEPPKQSQVIINSRSSNEAPMSISPATADNSETGLTVNTPSASQNTGQGFFQKAGSWIKDHPAQTALIGAAIAGAGYMIYKSAKGNKNKKGNTGLSGLNPFKPKPKRKYRRKRINKLGSIKIK